MTFFRLLVLELPLKNKSCCSGISNLGLPRRPSPLWMGAWYDVSDDGSPREAVINCWRAWFIKSTDSKEISPFRSAVSMRLSSLITVGSDPRPRSPLSRSSIIAFNSYASCCWKSIVLFWVLTLEYRSNFKEENQKQLMALKFSFLPDQALFLHIYFASMGGEGRWFSNPPQVKRWRLVHFPMMR